MKKRAWIGRTQGGSFGQKSIMLFLRYIGLVPLYGILACVVPFYMLFSRSNRKAIEAYLQRCVGHLSPWRLFVRTYKNHYYFAQAMIDRFALLAGLQQRFRFGERRGEAALHEALKGETGIILAGSHVGNMEMAGYLFEKQEKRFNAIVFGAESPFLQAQRAKALAVQNLRLIPISEDLSHLFVLHQALRDGECVALHCDRNTLGQKYLMHPFLGAPAPFPTGCFHLALRTGVPVYSLFVMRERSRVYSIHVKNLSEALPKDGTQEACLKAYVEAYVSELERIIKRYPEQWYNFYDFWKTS
jgi:Predicted acyltransferase